jgi:hypothetical protein
MRKIQNVKLANETISCYLGDLKFDAEGIVEINNDELDLTGLLGLKGYSLIKEAQTTRVPQIPPLGDNDTTEVLTPRKTELEELTIRQLVKYAEEHRIILEGVSKKADIIQAILDSEE